MVTQVADGYADIYTWENLYTAYRKAVKGKRSRRPAAAFEFKLEDNLIQLCAAPLGLSSLFALCG